MNEEIEPDAYSEYLRVCLARMLDEGKEVHRLQVCGAQLNNTLEASGIKVNRIVPGSTNASTGVEKKYRATFVPRRRIHAPKPEPEVDDEPAVTAELLEAYRKAEYAVFFEPEFVLRIGEYSAQLASLLSAEDVPTAAFITAYNPKSELFADKWNRELGTFLEHDVLVGGYSYFQGEGRDPEGIWKPEKSLLITGITKEAANRLAGKYGQHAFVFVDEGMVPEINWCNE